jgi:hypothetical protein
VTSEDERIPTDDPVTLLGALLERARLGEVTWVTFQAEIIERDTFVGLLHTADSKGGTIWAKAGAVAMHARRLEARFDEDDDE